MEDPKAWMSEARITIDCSRGAAEHLMPLLKAFKNLGELGGTVDFSLKRWDEEFTFDGDGEDKIASISQSSNVKVGLGKCPTCGAPGVMAERCIDGCTTCSNGHRYLHTERVY